MGEGATFWDRKKTRVIFKGCGVQWRIPLSVFTWREHMKYSCQIPRGLDVGGGGGRYIQGVLSVDTEVGVVPGRWVPGKGKNTQGDSEKISFIFTVSQRWQLQQRDRNHYLGMINVRCICQRLVLLKKDRRQGAIRRHTCG